ncbi:MAG: type II toxin-antitoxin system Phd/YefM family antitoxin [Streptosporangiales bacterium]
MAEFVPVSEAKGKLSELVRESDCGDVVLMKHGRPAAVVLSARRHEELMEQLDDLEDRLSVYEAEGLTMDYDKLRAELGFDEKKQAS